MIVSKWTDRIERMRVGWTIRLNNGKLATVTWVSPTGEAYSAKVIETLLDAETNQSKQ